MPFKRSVSNEFHLEQNMLQLQLLISLQLSTLLLGYCLSPRKTRSKWSLMELLLFVASKERSWKENVLFKFWWTKEVTCFLDKLCERNKKKCNDWWIVEFSLCLIGNIWSFWNGPRFFLIGKRKSIFSKMLRLIGNTFQYLNMGCQSNVTDSFDF